MKGKAVNSLRTLLVLLALSFFLQAAEGQRVTGQSASEAFSQGDFKTAYEHYSSLLGSFPRDPVYLYGAGVSLVRLSLKPGEATDLLERAINLKSSIRNIPGDAVFWLGRALHLDGRYDEAAEAYRRFSAEAGRREARDKDLPALIRQCEDRTGALAKESKPEPIRLETVVMTNEPSKKEAAADNPPEPLKKSTDSLLSEALIYRQKSDSLAKEISTLEAAVRTSSGTKRTNLQNRIRNLRDQAGMWDSVSDSLIVAAGLVLPEPDSLKTPVIRPAILPVAHMAIDTLKQADSIRTALQIADTAGMQVRTRDTLEKKVTSLFKLHDKPYYSASTPVQVSAAFPKGLFHTIQLAVFRNPVDPANFKRLYPIFGIKAPGSELTFYYAGLFRRKSDADKALQSVRNEGFKDAFVVTFMDGSQVSSERGLILEKEWGTRALPEWRGVVPDVGSITERADTVPPTLLFRVEIMRTEKPATDRQVEEIERIASERGLEILNPSARVYVYIVGKFLTFDSASSYADLLKRNGYSGARVAAYLGTREIPVETAMKLFDRKEQ